MRTNLAAAGPRIRTAAVVFLGSLVIYGSALCVWLPSAEARVRVRWASALADADRLRLEERFQLRGGERDEGTTFVYLLGDRSTANIKALIEHAAAEDTDGLNRSKFRPFDAFEREKRIALIAAVSASGTAALWLFVPLAAIRLRETVVVDEQTAAILMLVPGLLFVLLSACVVIGAPTGIDPLWDPEAAVDGASNERHPAPDLPSASVETFEGRK